MAKILTNRAVLGEFQPHVRTEGKPVPEGEPVVKYFPAIIDDELFYQAQLAKAQRRGTGAGRKGAGSQIYSLELPAVSIAERRYVSRIRGTGERVGNTHLRRRETRTKLPQYPLAIS